MTRCRAVPDDEAESLISTSSGRTRHASGLFLCRTVRRITAMDSNSFAFNSLMQITNRPDAGFAHVGVETLKKGPALGPVLGVNAQPRIHERPNQPRANPGGECRSW